MNVAFGFALIEYKINSILCCANNGIEYNNNNEKKVVCVRVCASIHKHPLFKIVCIQHIEFIIHVRIVN